MRKGNPPEPDVVKRQAPNDESINEQGINAGSIPDSSLQCEGLGREKVRSIRTPVVLSSLCVVLGGYPVFH